MFSCLAFVTPLATSVFPLGREGCVCGYLTFVEEIVSCGFVFLIIANTAGAICNAAECSNIFSNSSLIYPPILFHCKRSNN